MKYTYIFMGLLLLTPYDSFADGSDMNRHPDKIRCIADKYVAGFPSVERESVDVKTHHILTYVFGRLR